MAYQLLATITAVWVPEGAGPVSVASAQSETLGIGSVGCNFPPVQITESTIGTLTAAQVNTACTNLGSLAASYFGTTTLATLQGWTSGNP